MAYSVATDRKWQKKWEEMGFYRFNPNADGEKLYCLEMFSYPSASKLHIGHWYNYAPADSWARMKRMQGYNVFQPMGFDAFGLPAENFAIKTGIHPQDSTLKNIETMEEQLRNMGGFFAWDHEISTCLPEYYKWTQWLFLQLYKNGLAYRKNAPVNWCPSCQTVLANEQVINGHCERCDSEVIRKNLTQWFFKITQYAQELLDYLPHLNWPEKTKKIQQNWIGRSEGAHIQFELRKEGQPVLDEEGKAKQLTVFTTRADTLYGVSYVVIAPESDLAKQLLTDEQEEAGLAYIAETGKASEVDRQATDRPKTGVFTGSYAIHPLTGEEVPVWMSDYVIASYGTGTVMAVPAHDERDYAFAEKYHLPIKQVIIANGDSSEKTALPFTDVGTMVNSSDFNGLPSDEARSKIIRLLEEKGCGSSCVNYRLRDWLVSRQRYWGAPIPIIHCPHCGIVPVPEDQLPVELPYDVEFRGDGKSPLATSEAFMNTTCPHCGTAARRDPDTLDTFVCSSWYYLRYADPKNAEKAFDPELVKKILPVDMYIGGAEHAAMHLLYARFVTKALRDLGYVDFDEPFTSLIHQGMVLGSDSQKMSKSKGNTVSPDEYIEQYGSDIFRMYICFAFAYTEGGPWSDDGVKAVAKLAARVERQTEEIGQLLQTAGLQWKDAQRRPANELKGTGEKELNYVLNHSIQGVTRDAEKFQFNTSLSRIMELTNALNKYLSSGKEIDLPFVAAVQENLLKILAPFAPHLSEEVWESMEHQESIFREAWPTVDEEALKKDEIEIAVQMNGQVKHRLLIPSDADQAKVQEIVLADETVQKILAGRTMKKFIYVRGRLANLVVG